MGISGSYGSDLPEVASILPGAQIIGTKDNILFRANPSLLGGTVVDNNLTSTSTTNALSAAQGKVLKDTIDGLGSGITVVDNLTTQSAANALSANQGYLLSQAIANTAPLASPALTGTPTAPTATPSDNSTQIATTAFVHAAVTAASAVGYTIVPNGGTTYTVPASAVTTAGKTIIDLTNASLTSITINAATATGKTAGDSVTISITGTYAAQLLVASGVTLNGTLAFSANAKIKTLIYRGSNTWTVLGG